MKKSVIATALVACALSGLVIAQQTGLTRVALQTNDLSAPGREGIQARVEFDPGAMVARHTHPGEEMSVVLEGQLELRVDGQAPKIVKAGEAFFVPAGQIHAAVNSSNSKTKVLVTYVVEKGKPVATPAK
jgi:quercetin dioxygenase-like cupin family protein